MEFPIAGVTANPWLLVLIGYAVGVLGGFFGVGGAFVATPALNMLGFPMAYAIGTDLAHIMGKSLFATALHRRLGHVDVRAGLILAAGTMPGVELGARAVLALERHGLVESSVRWAYVVVLFLLALVILREVADYSRWRAGRVPGGERPARPVLAESLHGLRWRPLVSLPVSGIQVISAWVLVGVGAATGFLAGFLGVGGGFIRVPALMYLVGMPARVAVGTDLMEVLFSGTYGAVTYALKGRVDVMAALVMLAGAVAGSPVGVYATRYAPHRIKGYFAATMLASAASLLLRQFGYHEAGRLLLFGAAGMLCLLVMQGLAVGLWRQRRRAPARA